MLAAWRVPPPDDASGTGDDLPAPEAELEPLDPDDDPLSSLLLEALEEGAREALLEPVGGGARLRLRIGDKLRKERKVSGDAPSAVADALDALAAADLQAIEGRGLLGAIRAGRARCEVSGLPVHLAYRVIDTPLGPSLAISLDDESRPARASLGELGLDLEGLAAFEAALARRQGITILAAPDPRDRALAYRACLERAVRLGGAVVSLERPVHAVVPGVTQLDLEPGVSPALEALLYPVPDWLGLEVPGSRHAPSAWRWTWPWPAGPSC